MKKLITLFVDVFNGKGFVNGIGNIFLILDENGEEIVQCELIRETKNFYTTYRFTTLIGNINTDDYIDKLQEILIKYAKKDYVILSTDYKENLLKIN